MKHQKPPQRLRKNGYAVSGIVRSNSLVPLRTWGEVERESKMRRGTLRRRYDLGEIEATVSPSGGLFFTQAQEAAAICTCADSDFYID